MFHIIRAIYAVTIAAEFSIGKTVTISVQIKWQIDIFGLIA